MDDCFKLFFRRIAKDLRQKQLLPLKLLFFMHSSTILVLYPYLTIHMRELGINVEEAAMMSAVAPVIAVLMPPVAGMIADKIGNFRMLLAFFSSIGGLASLLLLLVPVGRITVTYPEKVVLGMFCSTAHPLSATLYEQIPCVMSDVQTETMLQLESCGISCHAIVSENQSRTILHTKSYELQLYNVTKNSTNTYIYTLTDLDMPEPEVISETLNHRTLKDNTRYSTSVRKLSENSYYFPTTPLVNFSCNLEERDKIECLFGSKHVLDQFPTNIYSKFNASLRRMGRSSEDVAESLHLYTVSMDGKRNSTCTDSLAQRGQHISVNIPIYESSNSTEISRYLELGSCSARCLMTTPRSSVCKNKNQVTEIDMQLTFWSYLLIRVFIGIVSGTTFAMFEGAVIAILREHKADYGLQRIYATIGGMISSPISGLLIDFASRGKGYTDFRPIFFLYAVLKIVSGLLMLTINLEFKKPAQSVLKDVFLILKKVELIALLLACLVMGLAWGYIESFLFWLLQDLGGSKLLMGLTITVGGIVGIPLLVLSGPLIKKIGHANVICIGFAFYAIRLIGYSLIYNPWLSLVFEAMESITFGLSFTAAVTYAAKLSSMSTDTTIQGLLGGLYFAVGKGIGSLIGGHLIKFCGIRTTFQIFAAFTAAIGFTYLMFYHLYMKKRPCDGTDITKKDVQKPVQDSMESAQHQVSTVGAAYENAMVNPAFEETEFPIKPIDDLSKERSDIN